MKPLQELTRPNIWALKPYSSARDEYNGAEASVFLDANENPYNQPNNRYPDPLQRELKNLIAPIKKVRSEQIFLGNGSDEAIDLVYRAFCRPGIDNVVAIEPTYGMYQVCADVNDVEYRKVVLDADFQLKAADLLKATDDHTKQPDRQQPFSSGNRKAAAGVSGARNRGRSLFRLLFGSLFPAETG